MSIDDLNASDLRRELARAIRKCKRNERRWVREFMRNGYEHSQAAKTLGLSPFQLKWMLSRQHVQRVLNCLDGMAVNELNITSHKIMREYARLAFSSPKQLFDENDIPIPISALDDDAAATVAAIEIDVTTTNLDAKTSVTTRTHKIKQHDKKLALDALVRFKKIAAPVRVELTGPGGGPIESKTEHSLDFSSMTDEQIRAIASIPIRRT